MNQKSIHHQLIDQEIIEHGAMTDKYSHHNKMESELQFLARYDPNDYQRPNTSVDAVIFTVIKGALHLLISKRNNHPCLNHWTLIGGYIDLTNDLDLESTAKRKLLEKTGVSTPYLEQFKTYGNRDRDPRNWSLTTVYFALIPYQEVYLNHQSLQNETDNPPLTIKWAKVTGESIQESLAFDHALIVKECLQRLRNKVLYTSLPVFLMPETFTLGELQKIYESILESTLEHKSFRRRILNADILEATGKMKQLSTRPAMLYRLKIDWTHFFARMIEH